jgi:SAM-dependent methyltransferase
MTARRATDAAGSAALAIFRCPRCGGRLRLVESRLECARRHRFPEVEGVFDLLGTTAAGGFDFFATPYGWLYDSGVKSRGLAGVAARLLWGAAIGEMYDMMDAGVRCEPGQVVLDVPCGGAPSLRTAAGRMRGTYVGIDLSLPMLTRAAAVRREENLDGVVLIRGDVTDLPLEDATVDRVLCFNGLHVLPDKAAALEQMARVLRPGGECWGTAVVGGPMTRPWIRGALFFHPGDAAEIKATAKASGFATWRQHQSGAVLFFRGRRAG